MVDKWQIQNSVISTCVNVKEMRLLRFPANNRRNRKRFSSPLNIAA